MSDDTSFPVEGAKLRRLALEFDTKLQNQDQKMRCPTRYLFLAPTSFAFACPAYAQDEVPLSGTTDIVVTAGMRETTLQESDLSVTVLDAAAIRETRLRDVHRIDDLVPNVQFNESGQLSSVFVSAFDGFVGGPVAGDARRGSIAFRASREGAYILDTAAPGLFDQEYAPRIFGIGTEVRF
jgi:hypothetical protein